MSPYWPVGDRKPDGFGVLRAAAINKLNAVNCIANLTLWISHHLLAISIQSDGGEAAFHVSI